MAKTSVFDIKHLARILYDNRTSPQYLSKSGQQQILAKHGHKVSRKTFDAHYQAVRKEIDKLHDQSFRKDATPAERERMAELFSQMDYIIGLKQIWDGEPDPNGKHPSFRDKLQAGKQAAEFFGWNAATNQNINITGDLIELAKNGNLLETTKQLPNGKIPIKQIE